MTIAMNTSVKFIMYQLVVSIGVTMDKTLPVLFKSFPGNVDTRSMYIPQTYQASPPTPVEDGVYIEDRPEMKVYVGYVVKVCFIMLCNYFLRWHMADTKDVASMEMV